VTVERLPADAAPARLLELSRDLRAAVLVDAAGTLAGVAGVEQDREAELAELAAELFEAADEATPDDPAEQVEAQVGRGAVLALRTPRWTVAVVGRRTTLSSLAFMDMRAVIGAVEGERELRAAVPGGPEESEE
jgi:hypothetical protein